MRGWKIEGVVMLMVSVAQERDMDIIRRTIRHMVNLTRDEILNSAG